MHLLSTQDMAHADRLTIENGVAGAKLMWNAAEAVADTVRKVAAPDRPIRILCGPGNNGGDGYALGAILASECRDVTIFALGEPAPGSDASWALSKWNCPVGDLSDYRPAHTDLIVDALFGAGLSRPLDGQAAAVVERVNSSGACVVAIDVPSGIGGDHGRIHGAAIRADHTVTFCRGKPGHWLYPGRAHRGELHVKDIGIDDSVLNGIGSRFRLNGPLLWNREWPKPKEETHKYERGAVAVLSGNRLSTGASRLSARAAARMGAGAVTIIAPKEAASIHAAHLTAIMVHQAEEADEVIERLSDGRERAVVAGPGYGVGAPLCDMVLGLLALDRRTCGHRTTVLDADVLTSFRDEPDVLFAAIRNSDHRVVLTPHDGEFARLFPDLSSNDRPKTVRVADAADRSGAVVLLKGADTVIAEPKGRIAINPNGTPLLATAGSGDVLAGMIAGLCAQSMPVFEACCAAAWCHAEAGSSFGPGLIADDLPEQLPDVLCRLHQREGDKE